MPTREQAEVFNRLSHRPRFTDTFSTETLDSTEKLALSITREQYARGHFDHDTLQHRIEAIIGLHGSDERARVLHTDDLVDITSFGSPIVEHMPASWEWPD